MTKDRLIASGFVVLLILLGLVGVGGTDGIFIAAAVAFFALCIAYTEWCGRL